MPTKSASRIITRDQKWLGPALHPGKILFEEYLKPLGVRQVEAPALGRPQRDLELESSARR